MAFSLLAALPAIGAAVGVGTNIFNTVSQYKTNQRNLDMQENVSAMNQANWREQFDYDKALQQEIFAREDTSYQRTVDDITSAGLSPLAIGGTNGAGQAVSAPSAPTHQAMQMQAPSFNMDSVLDVMANYESNKLQERALDIQEAKNLSDTEQRELDREAASETVALQLQTQSSNIDKQIASNKALADDRLLQEASQFNKQHALNLENVELTKSRARQEYIKDEVYRLTDGKGTAKEYDDFTAYQDAYAVWAQRYSDFLEMYTTSTVDSRSHSKSQGLNEGQSIGANANASSYGGFGVSGSSNQGSNYGESISESYGSQNESKIKQWLIKNPVPVYTGNY